METEQQMRARIEAEVRAEMQGRQQMNQGLYRLAADAQRAENGTRIAPDFNAPVTDNAMAYGTVLAMQMLQGATGTGLADDGMGDGRGT